MDPVFMNSKYSKCYDLYRLLLHCSEKKNLKRSHKYFVSSNLSIYYPLKNMKKPYKNNKFKISALT